MSTVAFSCRLPVMVETTGTGPVSFQGGFVSFPSGIFSADPRGVETLVEGVSLETAQTPVLRGDRQTGLPFYDAAQNRWLPVAAAQTSPDGSSYAYATIGDSVSAGGTIHVVDVATGSERTFKVAIPVVGAPAGLQVDDFDGASVYFVVQEFENYPAGVWRLDMSTGHVTAMSQVANVFAIHGGTAWIGYVDPHDPNPPQVPASVRLFNSLVQVNLASGARTTWFYRPGVAVTLEAIDSNGRPIVRVNDGPNFTQPATVEYRRLTSPLSGGEDNGDLVYSGGMLFDVPVGDADRIWLGNDRGIYLYTTDGQLQKVYAVPAKDGVTYFPAGVCS